MTNSVEYLIKLVADDSELKKKLSAGELLSKSEMAKIKQLLTSTINSADREAKNLGKDLKSGLNVDTTQLEKTLQFISGIFEELEKTQNPIKDWAKTGKGVYSSFEKMSNSVATLAQNVATLQTDLNQLNSSFSEFKSTYQSFDPAKFAGAAQVLDNTAKSAQNAGKAVKQTVTEMAQVATVSNQVDAKLQKAYASAVSLEKELKKASSTKVTFKSLKEADAELTKLEKQHAKIFDEFDPTNPEQIKQLTILENKIKAIVEFARSNRNKLGIAFSIDLDDANAVKDYLSSFQTGAVAAEKYITKVKTKYNEALKGVGKDTSPNALVNQLKNVKLSLRVPNKSELVGEINKLIDSIQPKDLHSITANVIPTLDVDAANPIEDKSKRAQQSKNGPNPASEDAVTDALVKKTEDRFARVEDVIDNSREKIVGKAEQWRKEILEKLQLPKLDLKFNWNGNVTDNFDKLYNDIQSYFDETPINIKINGENFAKQIEGAINEKGLTLGGGGGTATIDANDIANVIKSIFTGEPMPVRSVDKDVEPQNNDGQGELEEVSKAVASVATLNREASQGVIDLLKQVASKYDNTKGGQNIAKILQGSYGIDLGYIDKHKYDDDIDEKIFDLLQKTLTKPDSKTGLASGRTIGKDLQDLQWLKTLEINKRGAKSIGFMLEALGRRLDNLLDVSGIDTETSKEAMQKYDRISIFDKAKEKHDKYFGSYAALDKVGAKKNFGKYINNPDLLKVEDIDVAISALEDVSGDVSALQKLKDARLKLGDSKDLNAIQDFKDSAYYLFDGMKDVSEWLKQQMGNFRGQVQIQGRSRPMPINNPYDMAKIPKDAVVSDATVYSAFGQNYRDNALMQARPPKQPKIENLNVTADKFHIQERSETELTSEITTDKNEVDSMSDLEAQIDQFKQNIGNLSQQIKELNTFIEQATVTIKLASTSKFDDANKYSSILADVINNGRNAISNNSTFDVSREQLKSFEENDKLAGLAVQQLQAYTVKLQEYASELSKIDADIQQREEVLSLSNAELEKRRAQALTNQTGAEALKKLEGLRGTTLPNVGWIDGVGTMLGKIGEDSAAFKKIIEAAKTYERIDENATMVDPENPNRVINKKDQARKALEIAQLKFIEETKALFDRMTNKYGKYNAEVEKEAYELYNKAIFNKSAVSNDIENLKASREGIKNNVSSTQGYAQKILTDLDAKHSNVEENKQKEAIELAAKLREVRQSLYDEAAQYVKIIRDDNADAATKEVTLAKLQQVLGGLKDTKASYAKIGHLVSTPLYDTKKQSNEVDKWTKEFVDKASVSNILRATQRQAEEKVREKGNLETKLNTAQSLLTGAQTTQESLNLAQKELEFVRQYNELLEKEKKLLREISKLKRNGDWKGVKSKYNEKDVVDGQIHDLLENNPNPDRHAYAFKAAEGYEADIRLAASQRRVYSKQLAELKATENEIKKSQFFTGKRGQKVLGELEDSLAQQFYKRRIKEINESYGPDESLTFTEKEQRDVEIEQARKAKLRYRNQLSIQDNQLVLKDDVVDSDGIIQEAAKVVVGNLQQELLNFAEIDKKRQHIKSEIKSKNLDQTISDLYANKKEAMRYGGITQAELNNSDVVKEQNRLLAEIEQLKETKQSLDQQIDILEEQKKSAELSKKEAAKLSRLKRERDDAEQKIADKTQFVLDRKNLIQSNESDKVANKKTAEENLVQQTQRLTEQKTKLEEVEERITQLKKDQKTVEKDSAEAERIKHELTDAKAKKKAIEGNIESTQKYIATLQKRAKYQEKTDDTVVSDDGSTQSTSSGGILGAIKASVREGVSGLNVQVDTSHLATEETLSAIRDLLGGDGDWEPEDAQDTGLGRNKKKAQPEITSQQIMSSGMEARIARANKLSEAGLPVSRARLLLNGDDAFEKMLSGDKIKDVIDSTVWPKMVQQLNDAGFDSWEQFNEKLSSIADNSVWKSKKASSWLHFATPDAKFNGPITKKAYGSFANIGNLSSDLINTILAELTAKGFKGQVKIPSDITGFYDTDQIVGHAVDDNSFRILVDTLQKFANNGVLSSVATGVDANTKVLRGKNGASFTQLIGEIYEASPGQTFTVGEVKSIITSILKDKSGKFGQDLVKPIVDSFVNERNAGKNTIPVEPEIKPGAVAKEVKENVADTPAEAEVKPKKNKKQVKSQDNGAELSTKDILAKIQENLLFSQGELKELSNRITALESSSDPNDIAERESLIATRDKIQENVTTMQQSLKNIENASDDDEKKSGEIKPKGLDTTSSNASGGGILGVMRSLAKESTLQKVLSTLGEIAKKNAMSGKPNSAQDLLEQFRRMLESDAWEGRERVAYMDLATGSMSNSITGDNEKISAERLRVLREAYANKMDMNAQVHTHADEDDPYFSPEDLKQFGTEFANGITKQILLSKNNMTVLDMTDVKDVNGLLEALTKTEHNFEALATTADKFGAKYVNKVFDELTPQGLVKMLGIKGVESKYTEAETRDSALKGVAAEDAKEAADMLQESTGRAIKKTVERVGVELQTMTEKTDAKGNKTWSAQLSNKYEKAMLATNQRIAEQGLGDVFGVGTEANKTLIEYTDKFEKLLSLVQQFKANPSEELQSQINALLPMFDKAEEKLISLIARKDKFLGDKEAIAVFGQGDVAKYGASLKELATSRYGSEVGLGGNVAFNGLRETQNGAQLLVDVLKDGSIKQYALEVDRATGQVKEFMVAENALANAFQNVNKAMRQNEVVQANVAIGDNPTQQAAFMQNAKSAEWNNYKKSLADMEKYVAKIWQRMANGGRGASQKELDYIMALSEHVLALGKNVQKTSIDFKNFWAQNPEDVTGFNIKLKKGKNAPSRDEQVRAAMEKYAQTNAGANNAQYSFASFDNDTLRYKLTDVEGNVRNVTLVWNELYQQVAMVSDKSVVALDPMVQKIEDYKQKIADAKAAGYLAEDSDKAFNEAIQKVEELEQQVDGTVDSFNKLEEARKEAIGVGVGLDKAITSNKRAVGTNAVNSIKAQYDKIIGSRSADLGIDDEKNELAKQYKDEVRKIIDIYNEYVKTNQISDPKIQESLRQQAAGVQKIGRELLKSTNEADKLKEAVDNSGSFVNKQGKTVELGGFKKFSDKENLDKVAAMKAYAVAMYGAEAASFKLNTRTMTLEGSIRENDRVVHDVAVQYNKAADGAFAFEKAERESLSGFPAFMKGLKEKTKAIAQYLFSMTSIYRVIGEVRKGVQYIKEIDLALVELRKVTDETEETYDEFLNTAAKTADRLGSTISAVTEATATFAKLGYTMEMATEMAEAAIVYKNVGDNIASTEDAANSIISTLKGFGLEASESMRIVDRFNEVGNKFAITSQGLGEALRLSASALNEGGNTLDESIGIITAANEVVNDPSSVGTALKTLTLRLRGSKTELEEMGEDVSDMATTTSQLQAKLLALTGGQVDIMLDENTFKSSTQILREMAAAWEDMNDIQRASALELMGGKLLPRCIEICA